MHTRQKTQRRIDAQCIRCQHALRLLAQPMQRMLERKLRSNAVAIGAYVAHDNIIVVLAQRLGNLRQRGIRLGCGRHHASSFTVFSSPLLLLLAVYLAAFASQHSRQRKLGTDANRLQILKGAQALRPRPLFNHNPANLFNKHNYSL